MTISDYWGVENLDKNIEDHLGVSMVMLNNEKGKNLFELLKGEKFEANINTAKQPNLYNPTSCPSTRIIFWDNYSYHQIYNRLLKYGAVKNTSRFVSKFKSLCKKIKRG